MGAGLNRLSKGVPRLVTDSRFFSQEFNTAIIDGPLRIYFSGRQESKALQIYFEIQERLKKEGAKLSQFPLDNPHLYLLLYPTKQSFINVFSWEEREVSEAFGEHLVLGVDCSDELENLNLLVDRVSQAFSYASQAGGKWPVSN